MFTGCIPNGPPRYVEEQALKCDTSRDEFVNRETLKQMLADLLAEVREQKYTNDVHHAEVLRSMSDLKQQMKNCRILGFSDDDLLTNGAKIAVKVGMSNSAALGWGQFDSSPLGPEGQSSNTRTSSIMRQELEGKRIDEIRLRFEHNRNAKAKRILGTVYDVQQPFQRICMLDVNCCGEKRRVFDTFINLLILVNVVCIGISSNLSLQNLNQPHEHVDLSMFRVVEVGFLVIYCIEIFLRWMAGSWKALCTNIVRFDMFLVIVGTVSLSVKRESDVDRMLHPFGMLRLLRVYKVIKTMRSLEGMWRLVSSMISATSAMTSTVMLLGLVLYIAACFAIELISKDPLLREHDETKDLIDSHFSSLAIAMVTCVQFVTVDGLADIYLPIVKVRGYMVIYFGIVIIFVSIATMNLVTASLVNVLLENARRNKEAERGKLAKLRPFLQEAFRILDVRGNNLLSVEEVMMCHDKLPPEVLQIVSREKLIELVEMLDFDDLGSVTEIEFVQAIEQIASDSVSFETMQQLGLLTKLRLEQKKGFEEVTSIYQRLKRIDQSEHKVHIELKDQNQIG